MTPRQPAEARSSVTRCQFQLKPGGLGKDEKRGHIFLPLLIPDESGLFVALKAIVKN
jgi:hypothetical protein